MDDARTSEEQTEAGSAPRGGMPGDGAGRIEDPGTREAGVWPVSGPPSGNPDARIHDMASFGQGDRGAAGYADSGQSEVWTVPPDGTPAGGAPAPASGSERGGGLGAGGVGDVAVTADGPRG